MSGESVGLPPLKPVANDQSLTLREQLELYVAAAIVLRDLVRDMNAMPVTIANPDGLRTFASWMERSQAIISRAVAILEQLGLKP